MLKEELPIMNIIREAENNDISRIIEIMTQQINNTILEKTIYGAKGIDKYLIDNLNKKEEYQEKINMVYEIDGLVVGYVELLLESENLFINYIVIDKRYTGKGIGKELLNSAIDKCSLNRKFKYIFIDVFNKNIRAKEWYKKIGFKEVSRTKWIEINIQSNYKFTDYDNIKITNYEKAKKQHDELGFAIYFIEDNKKIYKIGFINEILKLYDYSIIDNYKLIAFIKREFNYKKVWGAFNNYLGKCESNLIDELIRMSISYRDYLKYT